MYRTCVCLIYFYVLVSSLEYLGCYLNEDFSVSNGKNIPLVTFTPETCSGECLIKNYTYAASNKS